MLQIPDKDRKKKERLAAALYERERRRAREAQSNSHGGLIEFVRYFWHVLEPVDPFIEGWPVECLCAHLEAITRGDVIEIEGKRRIFNRFLANVPPGFMKSLLVNVFWPAWEWGPQGLPHLRYVAFSYASGLTERDNAKFRDLVSSPAYRELWGHVFKIVGDGQVRVTNDKTGFKFASSFGGIATGERGHRCLLDDPHKLKGTAESDDAREAVVTWFREGMQNRLNDLKRDAIIVIMQRVHQMDTSGAIQKYLSDEYCQLIIPMEFEANRHFSHYQGWNDGNDPREYDGELAWSGRYAPRELASFKRNPYLWSGQYQQSPTTRGGGLFKDNWWQVYQIVKNEKTGAFNFRPELSNANIHMIVASLDTAFSEREENDFSALSVLTVFDDPLTKKRRILLTDAWQKRLSVLHGEQLDRNPGETDAAYRHRSQPHWGLIEWVAYTCSKCKVDRLLVENKNRGHDVVKEIKRLYSDRNWGVRAVDVRGDKWSRAHSVVDLFTDEMIYAPAEITEQGDVRFRDWAQLAIDEMGKFPRGEHDDLVDSIVMGLGHLRQEGLAVRRDETAAEERAFMLKNGSNGPRQALYPA